MIRNAPDQLWWTAEELAASGLPEMPGTKQGVNRLAKGWRVQPDCVRRKAGRGGGFQYHWSVLPDRTRAALLTADAPVADAKPGRADAWAAYDSLPDSAKMTAQERLAIIQNVEMLQSAGATKTAAIEAALQVTSFKPRAVFDWFKAIEGVAVEDRLAYLIPRHRLADRARPKSASAREFLEHLKSLFLRLEGPTFRECYRDACDLAKAHGWATLRERTAKRRIEADVPYVTRVFLTEGEAGLMRCFPAQIRDRTGLHALEGVNADCHKIDVFVKWEDGTVDRPQIVAFQDLYSNKMLSWRVDHNPNKVMVMAAFGEMIETHGIPKHCLFDNGREFANKWLTAGAPTRFRFKVLADDPLGVLPLLGIKMHWATPGHGQAKPIERGFRDFADNVAKDPRFAGAYVGKNPMAKPENYGERAVPIETFLAVLAERIAKHNAREGRTTKAANGRSFDQTFAESYARAPIQRATEEQRRLWMFGQHNGELSKRTGALKFQGNEYHSEWMSQLPGKSVVARFDPEDLHAGLHIYAVDGEYLGFAECRKAVGFFDIAGARENARRNSRIRRAEKAIANEHRTIAIEDIAAKLDALQPTPVEPLENKVAALPKPKPRKRIPERVVDEFSKSAAQDADIIAFSQKPKAEAPKEGRAARTAREKFFWAQSVLARSERGEDIGIEEARQVRAYVETAEYKANLQVFESFGKEAVK